jgi:glucokinase
MDKILLIDLGGTYIRFVVLSTESNEIDSVNKKKLQSTENFETVLKEVLAENKNQINNLVLSIAGPKLYGSIEMTNRTLSIDAENLKQKFNLQNCLILNDWEAIAHSYQSLNNNNFVNLVNLETNFYNNNLLFFGPGTGLGVSLLINSKYSQSTEIGNISLGVNELIGDELFSSGQFSKIEDTISGPGISKIYELKKNQKISSEDIFKLAENGEDIAIEIIEDLINRIAILLSQLTLTYLPGKGIFLAGSMMRSLIKFIDKKKFKKQYLANIESPQLEILKVTQINVVTKENLALYGCLNYFNSIQKDLN